jgi:hypothetical protein
MGGPSMTNKVQEYEVERVIGGI